MYPLSAPHTGPIGVFDSGYGGLTILGKFIERLPQYDYLYLGDNARAPYGTRSFEVVYDFTLQAVKRLFELGCPLVILACNTASAKALRSIQQNDLPHMDPTRRVLGVIRPTVECIGEITVTGTLVCWPQPAPYAPNPIRWKLKRFFRTFRSQEWPAPCGYHW